MKLFLFVMKYIVSFYMKIFIQQLYYHKLHVWVNFNVALNTQEAIPTLSLLKNIVAT